MSDQMLTAEEFFEFFTGPMDGESDLMPTLLYNTEQGGVVAVFADTHPPERGGMQQTLLEALARLRVEFSAADWVWFGSEAYAKKAPVEGMEKPRPGQLQAEFGTDPDIVEVVMICGVSPDHISLAQRRFKRENGEVVWLGDLEVTEPEGEIAPGGGIVHILSGAVMD